MNFTERSYSVLLASSSEKINQIVFGLLPSALYSPVTVVSDVDGARRLLLEKHFDIVIINDFGTSLALDLCSNSGTGILMLVKSENYADISAQLSRYGILTVSKPISAEIFTQSLLLLCGTCERFRMMSKKATSVEDKMAEIRLINQAKWLLINHLRMTEKDAHRFIEKQAMDRCVTRIKIAEKIISMYK